VHIYESDSENRTKEIIKDMESLFDKNGDKIAGVLVYIDASDDLTIDEVNEIISTVRKKLNDNAMVIWSAKVNDENNSMILILYS
jgi:cell division GTPase FtsZ